jgi:hypothetical protein
MVEGVVKPKYIAMVGRYLEKKEWPHGGVCDAWHAWLGEGGFYSLVDAYVYFDDWPADGWEKAELDWATGRLVLQGKMGDGGEWIEALVDRLFSQICVGLRLEWS